MSDQLNRIEQMLTTLNETIIEELSSIKNRLTQIEQSQREAAAETALIAINNNVERMKRDSVEIEHIKT